MIETGKARTKLNLYRLTYMVSGVQNFTATTTHDILSTVVFPELI